MRMECEKSEGASDQSRPSAQNLPFPFDVAGLTAAMILQRMLRAARDR